MVRQVLALGVVDAEELLKEDDGRLTHGTKQ